MTYSISEDVSVLLVDDKIDNLNLLGEMLERAGFKVRPALSGDVALRAIAASRPDLILMDIRMPGMDGYETCKHLKADPRTCDIPVIFISALQEPADRIAAFEAGGVDYVTKPFFEQEVLARVETHIHLYRIRRELEQRVAARTQKLEESEARLRRLSIFLQRVREEDRAHFARELHDELGQNLTALRIDFNGLAQCIGTRCLGKTCDGACGDNLMSRLEIIDRMITSTVDSTRRICEELRPGMLDDLGLEAALASYAKRFSAQYGVACDLSLDREDFGLGESLATTIFRIVQESLTNIARHARATTGMVALQARGDDLLLTIADDGCGLPSESGEPGERKTYGLLGMRERVDMLGGKLTIDSEPGRGTHIEALIPRRQVEAT